MSDEPTNPNPSKPGLVFKNAPVVFAACRVTIDPPIPINIGFVDAFRQKYGKVDIEIPMAIQMEVAPGKGAPEQHGPIAALSFLIADCGLQVVIQSDVIVVRWMRTPVGMPYPGFTRVLESLLAVVSAMKELLADLRTPVAHVVYFDMLYDPELNAKDILDRYFNDRLTMPVWSDAKDLPTFNINWVKADDINFRVTFHGNPAPLMLEDIEPVNVRLIEWSAICLTDGEGDIKHDFNRLHRSIDETFMDVISDEAKREWGYENN